MRAIDWRLSLPCQKKKSEEDEGTKVFLLYGCVLCFVLRFRLQKCVALSTTIDCN